MKPVIKKLKKGNYGIFTSEQASLDCIPQYTAADRDSAEFIRMRMINDKKDKEDGQQYNKS